MHFYGWKAGLKTGLYYLRTRPAAQAIQFTIDTELLKEVKANQANQSKQKQSASSKTAAPASAEPVPVTVVPKAKVADITTESSDEAPLTPDLTPSTSTINDTTKVTPQTLDERTAKAAEQDPEFAAALQRQRDRELEQAKLMCSLENKEACVMCSG